MKIRRSKASRSEHGQCIAALRYGALAQAGCHSFEQRQRRAEVGAYYDREILAGRAGEAQALSAGVRERSF